MIRHIYDLPYDQMLEGNISDDTAAYSTNEDLLFHIAVFTAADKYDVATLRPLVVKKFEDLMETTWEGEQFATAIQKLTGPSAGHLADSTLQAAAAAFCAKHLKKLIKSGEFVKMIKEEEPFTGRLLSDFMAKPLELPVPLKRCTDWKCTSLVETSSAYLAQAHDYLSRHCAHCGEMEGEEYYNSGSGYASRRLESFVSEKGH